MSIKDLISSQPKWQHSDPEVRSTAIGEITDPDIIKQLIMGDPEEQVRCAAIAQLQDYDELASLTGETGAMGEAARRQYCHLLACNPDLSHSKAAVIGLDDPLLLKEIALSTTLPDLSSVALDKIEDEDLLTDIACQAGTTSVRQAAANRIVTVTALEILQKRAKHKDKLVLSIAKTKLRAVQKKLDERQQVMADAAETAAEMQQLAKSTQHPSFERTFNHLESKWKALENQFQDLSENADQQSLITIRDTFEQSKKICTGQIGAVLRDATENEQTLIEAVQIVEQLDSALTDLQQSCETLEALAQPVNEIRQRWHHLSQHKLTPELSEDYYRALNKLEFLIDAYKRWSHLRDQLPDADAVESTSEQLRKAINNLHWPDDFPPPEELTRTRLLLEKSSHSRSNQPDTIQKTKHDAQQKLNEFDAAIREGHIKQANKLMREARQAIGQLPRPGSLFDHLHRSSKQLDDLKDWQGYATSPKREELCVKMENLQHLQLHPRDQADRIRELHKEWKDLGDSHGDQKRWHRFKQASDTAYEPCREFFQKQASERHQKFQERTQICDQLEDFNKNNNWELANWKAVAEIITTARRQWRQLEPIDHAHRKTAQPRFYKILDVLQARLKVEQDRNRDLKTDLASQVEKIVAEEDLSSAIEQTIGLQKQWQQVGVTDRKVDQKLWKKFRQACDAVFDRKTEQRNSDRELEEKNLRVAENLCKTMAGLATSSSPENPLSRSELGRFKSEFNQIDIAHRFQKKINNRFNKACTDYTKAIETQALRQRGLVIDELAKLAGLCAQLESHKGDADSFEHLKADLEQQWSSSVEIASEIRQRIDHRWSASKELAAATSIEHEKIRAENCEAARLICIKLELLAGIESPEQDQEMRMAFQVSRLKREFSERIKETRSHAEQLRSLQIDWHCLGPLPAAAADELKQRFLAATEHSEAG